MKKKGEKSTLYVHYGSDYFDKEKVSTIDNEMAFKPRGLWASPKKARWSWRKWCLSEDFYVDKLDSFFYFKLSDKANILHLDSLDEAIKKRAIVESRKYTTHSKTTLFTHVLYRFNHQYIYSNYDGVELHISNDYGNFHFNNVFNSWDVDSICIWNPDIIIPKCKK